MYSFEDRIQWIRDNAEFLASHGTVAGIIIEMIAATQPGREFVNGNGYDYLCETYNKVEAKSTVCPQGKYLRIQNFQSKRGKFDYMHVIDGVNNREFFIPHDDWFDHIGNENGEFHWSVSYNLTDKVRVDNTAFLIKYETRIGNNNV